MNTVKLGIVCLVVGDGSAADEGAPGKSLPWRLQGTFLGGRSIDISFTPGHGTFSRCGHVVVTAHAVIMAKHGGGCRIEVHRSNDPVIQSLPFSQLTAVTCSMPVRGTLVLSDRRDTGFERPAYGGKSFSRNT
jgi:hypothetical protein